MTDAVPLATGATAPSFLVAAVVRELGACDARVRAALDAAGLDLRFLEEPDTILPVRAEAAFIETLAQLYGQERLGLSLGLRMDPRGTSLLGYLFINAASIGAALAATARYLRVVRPATLATLTPAGFGVTLGLEHLDRSLPRSGHHAEFMVGTIVAACRRCGGPSAGPFAVRFVHTPSGAPQPVGNGVFCEALGATVAYGAPRVELDFAHEALAAPTAGADNRLFALLENHARHLLASAPPRRAAIAEAVERVILDRLREGAPVLAQVARALGFSARTLGRRLAAEGLSYRAVLDDLRRRLAESYLSDRGVPLVEVAFLLGFADQSSFTTAFRRWNGVTPGAWRSGAPG